MPGIFDRIKDTTTYSGLLSVGTSFTVTNTPAPIYQSFRSRYAINDANIPVAIVSQTSNDWMICWCTYTALDTLRVDSIIFTSNTVTPDAAVTFSGTSDVFVTASSRAVAALREVNTFTANNYFTTGNVGIGTTSPGEKLSVATGASEFAVEWSGPGKSWVLGSAAGRAYIRNKTDSVEAISILNAGNVGIGTTSPPSPLVVNTGTGNFDAFNGATGTISFGNGVASGTASPAIIGAASSSTALRLVGRSVDGLSSGDMSFDARPSAGGDFTTLTNPAFVFNRFGTNLATILRNGNVGIGTSAPSSQLHVVSATNFHPQIIADHVAGAGTGAAYFLLDRARGTPSARTAVVSGDTLGTLMGRGYDGSAQQNAAFLSFDVDGTVSAGNVPAGITFFTTPVGGSTAARMHVDADGNVGIGTTGPSSKLSVSDGTVRIDLSPFSGTTGYVGTQSNHPLGIMTNNVEAIRVLTNGNVGIGTTSPSALLTIDDNAASGTGLVLTGGGSGQNLASFIRDVGSNAAVKINASGGDPQIVFESSFNTFTIGTDGNDFKISDDPVLGNTDRLTINSSGNVGIGTASPLARLHVSGGDVRLDNNRVLRFADTAGTGSAALLLQNDNNFVAYNAAGVPAFSFTHTATPIAGYGAGAGIRAEFDASANWIRFLTNNTEAMRIQSNQRVGIGTTSAQTTLHVSGTTTVRQGTLAWNQIVSGSSQDVTGYFASYVGASATSLAPDARVGFVGWYDGSSYYAGWTDGLTPMIWGVGGVTRMEIQTNGNMGICNAGGTLYYRGTDFLYGNPGGDHYINVRVLQNISTVAPDGLWVNYNSLGTTNNTIKFFTPGTTERMRIRSDGGVAIGSAGGDFARDWRLVVRHDNAGLAAQVGILNVSTTPDSNARFVHITGTGNSFTEHALIEVAGPANYFSTEHGSAVTYQRWTFNGTERLRLRANGNLVIVNDTGQDDTQSIGFRGAPNNVKNAAYTFALTDAGKTVYHDEATARIWTIPANSAVPFPIGTCIIIDNTGNAGAAGTITLQITTDTLRRGDGTAGVGQRTIAANRVAMVRKTKTTEWVITGTFG